MKLYYDPISTTSRPVLMFIADQGLDAAFETMLAFVRPLAA